MVKPSMKTSLSLLLGKIEATPGTDSNPTASSDAFLVGNLDYQLNPTPLERNVMRRSLSPVPNSNGRKAVAITFDYEIKGSGDVGVTRPKLGSLLRACGMKETLVTAGAATQIADPVAWGSVTGADVTFAKTTAPSGVYGSYMLEVVVGGASGTAEIQVTRHEAGEVDTTVLPNTRHDARVNDSAQTTLTLDTSNLTALAYTVAGTVTAGDDLYVVVGGVTFAYTVTAADAGSGTPSDSVATNLAALIGADPRLSAAVAGSVVTVTFTAGSAPVVVTSGTTALTLGSSGAEVTPTWAGNLVEGQRWVVVLNEVGYSYQPMSDANTETITLYVFKDGVLHKATSCLGTVTFTGEAGNLGTAQFEFQGNYQDPVEEPLPLDAVFEGTVPPQVELAQMSIKGDLDFCAQAFTYTLGNTIGLKECMNAQDGYNGARIESRDPTAQLNPEATYEAYTGMWQDFSSADQFPLHTRVGSVAGNTVRFYVPRASFTGLTYGDRNNTVTFESNFQLNGLSASGDDELRVVFT